ncbi:MAG: DUF6512 family protein [Clostridia bacterium]
MEKPIEAAARAADKRARACILWGIPVLFVVGGLCHFLYAWLGERLIVGLFVPVNESVFEHVKMVPLPMLLGWGACFLSQKRHLRKDAWFTGALCAMASASWAILFVYYFYTEAFGVELLAVDILILLAALALGQLLGLHIYRHSRGIDARLSVALIFLVLAFFALLTLFPPRLPLFYDATQASYGIPPR